MEPLFESLSLLPPTDVRLNTISREVNGSDFRRGRVDKIAGVMLDIAMGERGDEQSRQPSMVGLAAPEIGAFVRIILWDRTAQPGQPNQGPDFTVVVNPRLTWIGQEEEVGKEACFSTGDIRSMVYRATSLVVTGVSARNEATSYNIKDAFQARIIQHEIDHLNGIRPPDRVRYPRALLSAADEIHNPDPHRSSWNRYVPFATWLEMKEGRP